MIENRNQNIKTKKDLFEYFVFLLVRWAKELRPTNDVVLSKLRLQKILFFAATINSQKENHPLLDIYDKFYALPYGPVEVDIYDAMNANSFSTISFNGNYCSFNNLTDRDFNDISNDLKQMMESAILSLKGVGFDYLFSPVFDLVDITHKWTVWEVSMRFAEIMGRHREEMTAESICDSKVKAFS
jgi:uncharacterized phage-associated protein